MGGLARALAVLVASAAGAGCAALLGAADVGYAPDDAGGDALAEGAADGPSSDGSPDADAANGCPSPDTLSAGCPSGRLRCAPDAGCDFIAATDNGHCGECARRCDLTCDQGTCAPFLLDDKSTSTPALRVVGADAVWAYWIAPGGQAFRVPADGGGGSIGDSITGAYGEGMLEDVAIDVGDTFYALGAQGVDLTRVSTGGRPLASANANGAGRVAFDDERVFWTEGRAQGVVGSVLKDGGGLLPIATNQVRPADLFVTAPGAIVYVSQAGAGEDGGIIFSATAASAGSPVVRIAGLVTLGALVGKDGYGYYSTLAGGEIWRFDTTTFTPQLVVGGLAMAEHLAVDASFVYFTGNPVGLPYGVYRVGRCGGPVTLVTASTLGAATSLVVYGAYVFWLADGKVYATSK